MSVQQIQLNQIDVSTSSNGQILTSNGTSTYWGNGFANGQSIAVSNLVITGAITAGGSTGSIGGTQVLTSNGTGVYWSSYAGSGGSSYPFTSSGTAPSNPNVGDRWYNTNYGTELIWIYDGNSYQWVDLSSSGIQGYVGSAGYTGSAGAGYQGPVGYTGSIGSSTPSNTSIIFVNNTSYTTSAGWRKVPLDTVQNDTSSWWDTTNLWFKPNVSGFYLVNARVKLATAGSIETIGIYKNGVLEKSLSADSIYSTLAHAGSAYVYLNGTTDYIELYAFILATGVAYATGSTDTYLQITGPTTGIGYSGSQGIIGYTGSQGIIGYSGSIGYVGSVGVASINDVDFPYRVSRLTFNGVNGSTTTLDYAGTDGGKPITFINGTLKNTIVKYGNTSFASSGGASNNYFQITNTLNSPIGYSDFTIEFWMYPTSFNNVTNPGIFDSRTSALDTLGFGLVFDTNTNMVLKNGANNYIFSLSNYGITLNSWSHIALERVSGGLTIYVNGASITNPLSFNTSLTNKTYYIASTFDANPFQGYIDDFRFTLGKAVYYTSFTAPTSELPIGYRGIVGSTTGFTGSIGSTGYSGSAGVNGYSGSIGQQGPAGGYTGSAGFTGSTGSAYNLKLNSPSTTYTLLPTDNGSLINISANVSLPLNLFTAGQSVSIYNSNTTSSINIIPISGVTLYLVGTANTSTRSLSVNGVATILCVNSSLYVVTGGGLS